MNTSNEQATYNTISYHEALGMMMWLMKHADYHRQWPVWNIDLEIVPPLAHEQVKIYFGRDNQPVGFVTWAWLSEEGMQIKLEADDPLPIEQWNAGKRLFFNDFVAPWGHAKQIFNDLKENVFRGVSSAGSIRRNLDGSIRVTNAWKRKQHSNRP